MSQCAKDFVEYWITEFLHPDAYEDEDCSESAANAARCLEAAASRGIAQAEIAEEYADLPAHIARIHERILDAELNLRILLIT